MCGLVGIFDRRDTRQIDESILLRMNSSIRHRGPDGEGIHVAPGIGLGHRRLSIIDLERGHQPMFNEDESVALVYNGEIYNFPELKRELEDLGLSFSEPLRYGSHRSRLGSLGAKLRNQRFSRHVCVRSLGLVQKDAVSRSRPFGKKAALLFRFAERAFHFRLRAEGTCLSTLRRRAGSIRKP